MSGKVVIALGAAAIAGGFIPAFKDMHHQGCYQSGWRLLWDQLVLKERAKHISSEEAVINAKARHTLGFRPGSGQLSSVELRA